MFAYVNHVADRFDLRRDIQLDTRVVAAAFDEPANRWRITTGRGEVFFARFCIMATGCLSVPKEIDIPGAARFRGPTYRTSRWPHEGVDFTGHEVAVIGTGSSGIQSIPKIAKQAAHVTVFQRTPNFSLPAQNHPADPAAFADWKRNRATYRARARSQGFGVLIIDEHDRNAADFTPSAAASGNGDRWRRGGFSLGGSLRGSRHQRAANDKPPNSCANRFAQSSRIPPSPRSGRRTNHPLVTKRVCVDTGYYETYNRDNVTLVDLPATPIERITETGICDDRDDMTSTRSSTRSASMR